MKLLTLMLCLYSLDLMAKNYLDESLKKFNWNGIEVFWIEDDSLPTFDVLFYFGSGALDDGNEKIGLTELTFSELTSGSSKYSQKQIVESLEFFGTNYGSRVTHEYSSFNVSGLNKNFNPSLKLICHLFNEASYPKTEINKSKTRILAGMKDIVTNHGALADHIFRIESMKGSGYDFPTTGFMSTIKKIQSGDLKNRLSYLSSQAPKRIYMRGDSTLNQLKNIIKNDCGWEQSELKIQLPSVKKTAGQKIFLVPVPDANQAQIRIGRIMTTKEVGKDDYVLKSFSGKYLGGGFAGRLVQELRVKRALTYSAGAFVAEQKNYGRIGITTFTKNETLVPMLNAINDVITSVSKKPEDENFQLAVANAKGTFLLSLESSAGFLMHLLQFDHFGREHEEIYEYSDKIDAITPKKLAAAVKENFELKKQVIVIVGNKSLEKDLKASGFKNLEVLDYKKYL